MEERRSNRVWGWGRESGKDGGEWSYVCDGSYGPGGVSSCRTPENIAGIIRDGAFKTDTGFISFKDLKSTTSGLGARAKECTASLLADVDVANAKDVTKTYAKMRALAKSQISKEFPKYAANSSTKAGLITERAMKLLHQHMGKTPGDVFKWETGGGYHYFVRATAQSRIGVVAAQGSDDAARLLAASVASTGALGKGIRFLGSSAVKLGLGVFGIWQSMEGTASTAEPEPYSQYCDTDQVNVNLRIRKEEKIEVSGVFSTYWDTIDAYTEDTKVNITLPVGVLKQLHGKQFVVKHDRNIATVLTIWGESTGRGY